VGKVLVPVDLAMGTVACLWKCLQVCEARTKMLSQCCWDTRSPRSWTVALGGSHICWADPRLTVVRALWESEFDSGLANENDFWIWSVLEAYDRLGGETWQ